MFKATIIFLGLLSIFMSATVFAEVNNRSSVSIRLVKEPEVQIQLQVRQAKLKVVLDEISRKTNVPIRYSVLPDELIDSTCVGSQLEIVLKCLFGQTVNLVFRYASGAKVSRIFPLEVWVIGSSFAQLPGQSGTRCNPDVAASSLDQTQQSTKAGMRVREQKIEQLLKDIKTNDVAWKAQIIADLAKKAPAGHAVVHKIIENALVDTSAEVRIQALLAWVAREGDDAVDVIWSALKDDNASVRITAVDLAKDLALWQQALNDPDSTVRQMAKIKINSMADKSPE